MKVLILANQDDAHAVEVNKHLAKMHAHVDFFRYEHFTQPGNFLTFRLGEHANLCTFEKTDSTLDLRQYFSVWFRRPGRVATFKFPEPWIETMVLHETDAACVGVFNSMRCLWVNHPLANNRSGHKLDQLNLAMQLGLKVPDTLVTNKPEAAREFFDQCDGQVIYKMLSENSNQSVPLFEGSAINTFAMRKDDLKYLDQVRFAPHYFQRRIKKSSDVRVTVVGKKIFAARIYSLEGSGKVDWRLDYSVKMEEMALPESVSAACVEFLRRFGLNYGAMDFCETEEGEFVFIENNNAGQYAWLEDRTSMPISLELAKLLTGRAEPATTAQDTVCGGTEADSLNRKL